MTRRRTRWLAALVAVIAVGVTTVRLFTPSSVPHAGPDPVDAPSTVVPSTAVPSTAPTTAPAPTTTPAPAPEPPLASVPSVAIDPAAIATADATGSAPVILHLDVTPSGSLAQRTAQVRATLDRVLAALPPGSSTDVAEGLSVPTIPMTVDRDALDALATAGSVTSVRAMRTFQPAAIDDGTGPASIAATTSIGANTAWAAGDRGAGVTVAVLDTGVMATHPFLSARTKTIWEGCFVTPRSNVVSPCPGGVSMSTTSAPVAGSAAPCLVAVLLCDHGTHVAGIAVGGTGTSGNPVSGIAPSANLVAVNVFGFSTISSGDRLVVTDGDLIRAMEWLLHGRTPVVEGGGGSFPDLVAVNLSLGDRTLNIGECPDDPLRPVIDRLAAVGVSTVAAAGNDSFSRGVSSPACIPGVIAVGALDDATGQPASFTNNGPQVDVFAPGVAICSSVPSGASGSSCSPTNGDDLRFKSGTSMATPVVTGTLALLRAEGLSASEARNRLQWVGNTRDCVRAAIYSVPSLRLDVALGLVARRPTPCAPSAPAATPVAPRTASVTWAPPAYAGTGTISSYTVTASTGQTCTVSAPVTSCVVSGAGPGRTTFTVSVSTSTGSRAASPASPEADLGFGPGSPLGSFDVARGGPTSVIVSGWTFDPDSAASIPVHVYVDGRFAGAASADALRGDVAAVFPAYGPAHGFNLAVPAAGGTRSVCVYAIDVVAPGGNVLVGCRAVAVPTGSPIGSFDMARGGPSSVMVSGWTFDLDSAASIPVHVYVDGRFAGAAAANVVRSDVGAFFVGYGSEHGFNLTVPAAGGTRSVCVFAIDVVVPGGNSLVGCRAVAVPTGSPIGSLDVASGGAGSINVGGWTIDPDTAAPIPVHVYVDGRFAGAAAANVVRSDVGAFFVGYGSEHGFNLTVPATGGSRSVCVYAIDVVAPGGNSLVGCRTVTVR